VNDRLPPAPNDKQGWPWHAETVTSAPSDSAPLPRITVVTPSFNQGEFLEEAIRSVLLQQYPNLQYIVVDGGSSDRSHSILSRYRDQIAATICEPDDGQSDAICKGLEIADGEFFNWINSDDILMPGALGELGTRSAPDTDLYTFSVSVFGAGRDPYLMFNRNLKAKSILRADRYSFSQPGLWFRTGLVRECGGIDRKLNYGFDWDLLIRYLAAHPHVHYSSTVGAGFRLHAGSKTAIESAKQDELANRFRQEKRRTREKLESCLPAHLAQASKLGRLREPWNEKLIDMLDDLDRSPLSAATEIFKEALRQPRVRCSPRTLGAITRLLSRYVRPRDSINRGKSP
jgi:hypothetical protein